MISDPIIECVRCPRLRDWCAEVAGTKVRRFADDDYWGGPVPSFGPMDARFLVVGLAPGAHGANRTGRLFTGDRSGDWLFAALYRFGFCSSPLSISRDDGLELFDCRITAVAHCAPPGNVLKRDEVGNCAPYLSAELSAMPRLRMILALGGTAYRQVCRHMRTRLEKKAPDFGHLVSFDTVDGLRITGSYHPSQQNTFTGKLTEPMFDSVFALARETLDQDIS